MEHTSYGPTIFAWLICTLLKLCLLSFMILCLRMVTWSSLSGRECSCQNPMECISSCKILSEIIKDSKKTYTYIPGWKHQLVESRLTNVPVFMHSLVEHLPTWAEHFFRSLFLILMKYLCCFSFGTNLTQVFLSIVHIASFIFSFCCFVYSDLAPVALVPKTYGIMPLGQWCPSLAL